MAPSRRGGGRRRHGGRHANSRSTSGARGTPCEEQGGSGVALHPDARRRDARGRRRGRRRPERRKGGASSPTTVARARPRRGRPRPSLAKVQPRRGATRRATPRRATTTRTSSTTTTTTISSPPTRMTRLLRRGRRRTRRHRRGARRGRGRLLRRQAWSWTRRSGRTRRSIRDAAKAPVASAPKRRKRDDAPPSTRPPPSEPSPKLKPKPKSKSARVADLRAPSDPTWQTRLSPWLAPRPPWRTPTWGDAVEDARLGLHELPRDGGRARVRRLDGRRVSEHALPGASRRGRGRGRVVGAKPARLGLADLERVVERVSARRTAT